MTYIVQDPGKNTAVESGKLRFESKDDLATEQKEMFLKLMIAQLRNQDPSAPMEQKDMMAQISQMSQVEMMGNMSRSMDSMAMSQGVDMIGKHVQFKYPVYDSSGTQIATRETVGQVDRIAMKDGIVSLVLTNGAIVKPGAITGVQTTALSPTKDDLGDMVGMNVEYIRPNADGTTTTLQGKANDVVTYGSGHRLKLENGATVDGSWITKVQAAPFEVLP